MTRSILTINKLSLSCLVLNVSAWNGCRYYHHNDKLAYFRSIVPWLLLLLQNLLLLLFLKMLLFLPIFCCFLSCWCCCVCLYCNDVYYIILLSCWCCCWCCLCWCCCCCSVVVTLLPLLLGRKSGVGTRDSTRCNRFTSVCGYCQYLANSFRGLQKNFSVSLCLSSIICRKKMYIIILNNLENCIRFLIHH